MVQHNNEHLTTTQLSAYVDQELSTDELTLYAVHLQTCQECQAKLADLRFTSALLHGMPQVKVPRSFALPLNIAVLPETPAHTQRRPLQASRGQIIIKRTLRAMSTIAAVIGLVFILTGALTALPHGGGMNASTAAPAFSQHSAEHSPTLGINSPDTHATQSASAGTQPNATRAPATAGTSSTPASAPTISNGIVGSTEQSAPTLPPALDLSQPEGRLSLGALLFVLGLLGILATRKRQPRTAH